jgi:putative DNA primase/helicase
MPPNSPLPPSSSPAPSIPPQQPQPSSAPQPPPGSIPRVVIRVLDDEMPRVTSEAEAALIANPQWNIYQRGGIIVRPIKVKLDRAISVWQLKEMIKPRLLDILDQVAQFEQQDNRSRGRFLPKRCPEIVANAYLARAGSWRLPLLAGIINTPFLRTDGSLCERQGYDPASALLFIPDGEVFPAVPPNPTRENAQEALKYINETLFGEFPFVANLDRAVALSALLTTFDRRCMNTAPMHAFSAPTAGTGKSLLVDSVSTVVNGQPAPATSQCKDEAELEKPIERRTDCRRPDYFARQL